MERNTIVINGKFMTIEFGHTEDEWEKKGFDTDNCWDFSIEDFLSGAIEPNEDITYWLIDGRIFETDIFVIKM